MPEKRQRGFTLIELLIVVTIIGILATITIPNYQRSVVRAREAVLMEDLYQMRRAIDAYFADHGKYPDSLEQLVENKYLRSIPKDPFFLSSGEEGEEVANWETVAPTPLGEGETAAGGVEDVRSTSDRVGLNGIPYREW